MSLCHSAPVRPIVLNLCGSDSSGMAGIATDIKTQAAMGVHSAICLTANTAQSNDSLDAINEVGFDEFRTQMNSSLKMPVDVIKTGLIANYQQIQFLKDRLSSQNIPLVCDPVLASSSGFAFHDDKFLSYLRDDLIPHAKVITPNLDEAEILCGLKIRTTDDVEAAAKMILSMGAQTVVIKGGHANTPWSQDFVLTEQKAFWLSSKRIDTINTRGTGCAFASAIASSIALDYSVYDSIVIAKMAINQGLRLGYGTETQQGPVSIQHFPDRQIDLPCLTSEASYPFEKIQFASCDEPLGVYPIVSSAHEVKQLCEAGVNIIQLRVKDLVENELEKEIKDAIKIAKGANCQLFINDYWKLAIKHQAFGVHLGQEDLSKADLSAIKDANIRLGISTHCHYEVARAHSLRPSYIAVGPVFPTSTKVMPWKPHDIEGLRYWRQVLNYPIVAIGGINESNLVEICQTGTDSAAMISAITQAENPIEATKTFIAQFKKHRS
ncbi:thiamine phosphate synthase [Pleionea sediminis]|uniref:thiamine phosphate synthase n=1 Tax=Pleionea sediminis TaxID=2569479 RepID=UPI001184DD51|nr:thiamine phosphate synthase [Pleionea sediminis]